MKKELLKIAGAGSIAGFAALGAIALVSEPPAAPVVAAEELVGYELAEAVVCEDVFAADENAALAAAYAAEPAECLFSGCGGLF